MPIEDDAYKSFTFLRLFLNREGRSGTTDDFIIRSLYFSLFCTALLDLAN